MDFAALTVVALLALCSVLQVSGYCADSYIAAVVEYHLNRNDSTLKNVARYEELTKRAKTKGADIIVFPDGGLQNRKDPSLVPDPVDRIIPCESDFYKKQLVGNLSCIAKNNKIYTVFTLLEKRLCNKTEDENCPPGGHYLLNTNVAFDRKGMVVTRYSKFNIYDEPLNKLSRSELGIFETDFGARFGTFISFDILHWNPTLRLIDQFGVTDIAFTSFWNSELPFLSALQVQEGWAETHNVNLLASGINYPSQGSGGSGIYNGKFGALVEELPEKSATKLLIATVPKIKTKCSCRNENFDDFPTTSQNAFHEIITVDEQEESFVFWKDRMQFFNSQVIETGKRFLSKICSIDNFCCQFDVYIEKISNKPTKYGYRAMVANAVRKFGLTSTNGIQTCGVTLCDGPSIKDCGIRARNITGIYEVQNIFIEGDFYQSNVLQFPSTLAGDAKLETLDPRKYEFRKQEVLRKRRLSLELLWTIKDLHTFGIYSRDFRRDGNPETKTNSTLW